MPRAQNAAPAMNALRRLLLPRDDGGATYLDHDGNAVVRADKLAGALAGVDDTIDRLVLRLARATGRTEAEIRLSEGLNPADPHQGGQNRRPGPTSEADARPQRPASRETTTTNAGRRHP